MSMTQEDIRGKYRKTIQKSVMDRYHTYFTDTVCYKPLKERCRIIDDCIDLRFKENEAFISEIAPPVVRKDYLETSAFLTKYFENDPVVTFQSIGGTPQQNAENLQAVISSNWLNTRFREECLLWAFDNIARYGTAVIFSQYNDNYRGVGLQTMYDPGGVTPYPRLPIAGKRAVVNYSVHPLNYFCDPKANSMGRKSYEGFIDQWYVADLYRMLDDPLYMRDGLEEAISKAKKGHKEEFWYGGVVGSEGADCADYTRAAVNPIRMYTLLNFEGNESDTTVYYIEMVADVMIRCTPLDVDGNLIPLNTGVYIPRPDVWWGNSSTDTKIPFQNLKNWIINAQVEGTMKGMDRIVLMRRGGGINVADVNNRHQFGGVVFYDGAEDPSKLMYQVPMQNYSLKDVDWLNRELNQMVQESSPVVNLQNRYNEGGLNNQTLGAAQMVAGIGEVIFGWMMRNVGYMVERVGEVNAALMMQNTGDTIPLRRSQYESEVQLAKKDILGDFVVKSRSAMLVNERMERTDKANMINQVKNWQATQDPIFQQINTAELLKDWLRAWIGQYNDVSRYMIQQPPQAPGMPGAAAPAAMPSMARPGGMQ